MLPSPIEAVNWTAEETVKPAGRPQRGLVFVNRGEELSCTPEDARPVSTCPEGQRIRLPSPLAAVESCTPAPLKEPSTKVA